MRYGPKSCAWHSLPCALLLYISYGIRLLIRKSLAWTWYFVWPSNVTFEKLNWKLRTIHLSTVLYYYVKFELNWISNKKFKGQYLFQTNGKTDGQSRANPSLALAIGNASRHNRLNFSQQSFHYFLYIIYKSASHPC